MKMEREANALLAKGDRDAAAAKFSEADRIATSESLAAVPSEVATQRTSDPAVRQIAAIAPSAVPDLAAPMDNPAPTQQPAPAQQPTLAQQPASAIEAPAQQPALAIEAPQTGTVVAPAVAATPAPQPLPPAQIAGNAGANRGEVLLSLEAQRTLQGMPITGHPADRE